MVYSGWWEQSPFPALCEELELFVPSSLFRWSLPDLWYFPHMYLLISTLLNTHGRPSLGPQSSLFVQLSSVWYSLAFELVLSRSLYSELNLFNPRRAAVPA